MSIHGIWQSYGSAAQSGAVLYVDDEKFHLEVEGGQSYKGTLETLKVSDRLGNVERKLTLEDGSIFSSPENDAIDELFKSHNKISGFVHAIESNIGFVVVAIVCTVVVGFSFFKWGIPFASNKIAHALPQKTNDIIAVETLAYLDKFVFEETTLNKERTEGIRQHFFSTLLPLDENSESINYKLHFRDWTVDDVEIPNALALPSGDIILTDRFVELSETQEEIDSVLLHEMGHVVQRHTLEMIIEAAFVTTAIMMMTGDNSGLVDMGTGLGALLISTNYSRNHEAEADLFAFERMLEAGIDPAAFSAIMQRITQEMEPGSETLSTDENKETNSEGKWTHYLSTHPSTMRRVKLAELYSKCFLEGLKICDVDLAGDAL